MRIEIDDNTFWLVFYALVSVVAVTAICAMHGCRQSEEREFKVAATNNLEQAMVAGRPYPIWVKVKNKGEVE